MKKKKDPAQQAVKAPNTGSYNLDKVTGGYWGYGGYGGGYGGGWGGYGGGWGGYGGWSSASSGWMNW